MTVGAGMRTTTGGAASAVLMEAAVLPFSGLMGAAGWLAHVESPVAAAPFADPR
jgi:hypothetical protein